MIRRLSSVLVAAVLLGASALALAGPAPLPRIPRGDLQPDRRIPKPNVDLERLQPRRWDFEDGTLQGFTVEDVPGAATGAFAHQPTAGDNVSAERALDTGSARLPPDPCAGLVLDERTTCQYGRGAWHGHMSRLRHDLSRLRDDHAAVGGGYWNTPFPIGKQGLFWIGSSENRPATGTIPAWGTRSGDRVTGRLVSPEIEVNHDWFHLLVGGGCSEEVGVYLQTKTPQLRGGSLVDPPRIPGQPAPSRSAPRATMEWTTVKDAAGKPIVARGACMESMVRMAFDVRHLRGTKVRILIEDRATGAFGHINVDDIWLTNTAPTPSSRDTDPVWGVADLHAHLMNEKAFIAYDAGGRTPEARALWGSASGPIENLRGCNDTHTTNDWNYNSHQDEGLGTTYTLCRDACLNLVDGAGLPERPGDQLNQDGVLGGYHDTRGGYPNFTAWPMWWSALHQQMHWTWVRRAYQGGVRMMIAAVGNSEVISFALVKEKDRPFTSDQDALALQIPAIKEFARTHSTWAEVAYTPRDARRIVNSGKLAIVIGVELDHVIDTCDADVTRTNHHRAREVAHPDLWISQNGYDVGVVGTIVGIAQFIGFATRVMNYGGHPTSCTDAQITARLDALYRAGVRQILPMHFSDNVLGGYAITGALFTASAIFGNPGAHTPTLMSQADLEATFGTRARPFTPVAREAYHGENAARQREWERQRPIDFELEEINLPIWARLAPEAILDGSVFPEGVGRSILQFFAGQCIEDDGWRVAAAIFTLGASEAACGISTLTAEAIDAVRSTMPYEGATDSPAMVPLDLTSGQRALAFHVNARGLTGEGEVFVREMMRRGMLIDIQHSSERAKRRILEVARSYPVMASHGGVQIAGSRANENVVSSDQLRTIYAPPDAFAGGLVGIGTQSSEGFVHQLRHVATGGTTAPRERLRHLHTRGVALGTDINGIDWHAPPRFGMFAFYPGERFDPPDPPRERSERLRYGGSGSEGIGSMVRYVGYPTGTNPWASTLPTCAGSGCTSWSRPPAGHAALNPQQVSQGGRVTRTFDVNYDGLAHYGLLPDFMQELAVLGASSEELGAVFRSAEGLIRMWEESCWQAYERPTPPASIAQGCGPRDLYR